MPESTALRFAEFGSPETVLKLERRELPALREGEVLLKVLAAPINPADFGRIAGTYGDLPELPATAGLEGVAVVIELGGKNSGLKIGQRVFIPSAMGSWQSHFVANANELFPAPEKLPVEQAAMAWVNPVTAWKLLHDFSKLQAGDMIAQNAATSAVGQLVIQIASHLGIRTVNFVRDLSSCDTLKELGANHVFLDDKDGTKAALEISKGKKAKLALNSVGGNSAYNLCKLLADQGQLVTFGGMDRDPAPFPTRYLIFNDIHLRGFWVSQWYQTAKREDVIATHNEVFSFMENAKIETNVAARYRLDQHEKAFEHAQTPGKNGKILFLPNADAGPH